MDNQKFQKIASGKKNKLQVAAYFTVNIEIHQSADETLQQCNEPPTIIITKYSSPDAEIDTESEKNIIISIDQNQYEHKEESEKNKQLKTAYIVKRTDENWYSLSIATWKLKENFQGEKFQIVFDPKDGEALIPIFVDLKGDNPYELPENVELKPEEPNDDTQETAAE